MNFKDLLEKRIFKRKHDLSMVRYTIQDQSNNNRRNYAQRLKDIDESITDNNQGTPSNDTITGGDGIDKINALGGNDLISGGDSNDIIDGGTGSDTSIYRGKFSDYSFIYFE